MTEEKRTVLTELSQAKEVCWINPQLRRFEEVQDSLPVLRRDLERFESPVRRGCI